MANNKDRDNSGEDSDRWVRKKTIALIPADILVIEQYFIIIILGSGGQLWNAGNFPNPTAGKNQKTPTKKRKIVLKYWK